MRILIRRIFPPRRARASDQHHSRRGSAYRRLCSAPFRRVQADTGVFGLYPLVYQIQRRGASSTSVHGTSWDRFLACTDTLLGIRGPECSHQRQRLSECMICSERCPRGSQTPSYAPGYSRARKQGPSSPTFSVQLREFESETSTTLEKQPSFSLSTASKRLSRNSCYRSKTSWCACLPVPTLEHKL